MQLDENLNLVLPLYRDDAEDAAPYAWVYSTPIGRDMFDRYYKVLCLTMAAIPRVGGSISVAVHCLKDAAQELGGKEADKIVTPLLDELRRLTEVAVATPAGWERMPLDDADAAGHISADDMREVVSAIVFFSAAWHTYQRRARREFLDLGMRTLGAQITVSGFSAFFDSLLPLTKGATGSQPPSARTTTADPALPVGVPPPVLLAL